MDSRERKLLTKMGGESGGRRGLASVLVSRGYEVPAKVKAATDEELLALPGISQAKLDLARSYFPYKEA